MSAERRELIWKLWEWIDPDIHFYSRIINDLLEVLTDEQLKQFVNERVKEEEDDGESE